MYIVDDEQMKTINGLPSNEYHKQYYRKNIAKRRIQNRDCMRRCSLRDRELNRERSKKSYYKNLDRSRSRQRRRFHLLRVRLMKLLGGIKCCRCGFVDYRALQFDHKNGGGRKELKKMGNTGMYYFYLKNPTIANRALQVLCANCNQIKKIVNRETRKRL